MPILTSTDSATIQEIRYEIYPELTAEEIPDAVITRRTVFQAANRETLEAFDLTEAEYDALPSDDKRREIAEEVAIQKCAEALIPTVAQIIMDNSNGLLTRYQRIDWNMRQRQTFARITGKLRRAGATSNDFSSVTSARNEERNIRTNRYR